MIKEEYDYSIIRDYLINNIDLIITGEPTEEERSAFIIDSWKKSNKQHLLITFKGNNGIRFIYTDPITGITITNNNIDITIGLPDLLRKISIPQKNVLLDLSSLDHVLIMVLIKQLIKIIIPKSLFAVYIRPKKYLLFPNIDGLLLSDEIYGVKAVPGFIKRENENQTLCSFIGFEGVRLKSILESLNNINKIVTIVAFPTGGLEWFKTTMWHCMDALESETRELTIRKCFSESIFDAVFLLNDVLGQVDSVVLAPFGTRPHSAASAIFAAKHQNVKIIHDNAIERQNRTEGISHICVYHLSSFIEI